MQLHFGPRPTEEGAKSLLILVCSAMLLEATRRSTLVAIAAGRPQGVKFDALLALQRTLLEAIPKDLSRPWEDPLPEQGERHLAQELRGIGLGGYEVPEWKQQALGKVRAHSLALRQQTIRRADQQFHRLVQTQSGQ